MKNKGIIEFLKNTNSASAADMAEDAEQIHLFVPCQDEQSDLFVSHWRIHSASDLQSAAEDFPDRWFRIMFIMHGGSTVAEDFYNSAD